MSERWSRTVRDSMPAPASAYTFCALWTGGMPGRALLWAFGEGGAVVDAGDAVTLGVGAAAGVDVDEHAVATTATTRPSVMWRFTTVHARWLVVMAR